MNDVTRKPQQAPKQAREMAAQAASTPQADTAQAAAIAAHNEALAASLTPQAPKEQAPKQAAKRITLDMLGGMSAVATSRATFARAEYKREKSAMYARELARVQAIGLPVIDANEQPYCIGHSSDVAATGHYAAAFAFALGTFVFALSDNNGTTSRVIVSHVGDTGAAIVYDTLNQSMIDAATLLLDAGIIASESQAATLCRYVRDERRQRLVADGVKSERAAR